ncbi:hypothetical protein FGRMN_8199 [Fusarium graminum]|nr:hypothetical protein FGRMN_8199 [Fusarium graminum]
MDPGLSSSSNVSPGPGPQVNRKERGAIAAQACETCRNRKQRCDEQRPKCSTCQRFKLECRYREPQPTKKDKTLVEILERLKSVEGKIDNLALRDSATSPLLTNSRPSAVYPANTPLLVDPETQGPLPGTSLPPTSPTPSLDTGGYRYDSSVSNISEWPVIRQMFESVGQKPPSPLGEIPALPGGIRDSTVTLPPDGLQPAGIPTNSTMQVPLHLSGTSSSTLNLSPPGVDWGTMQRLSKSYFDVINVLHPVMDRQWFNSNTLGSILSNGFQEGATSSLVLLVLALGEMALTTSEVPISAYKQRPSGIKGGTVDRPPGLAYFNEARKRMGFALSEASHFHEHFASQIVLQRLSVNFHSVLSKAFGVDNSTSSQGFGSFSGSASPGNAAVMKQLDAQLDQWRGMLPSHLRWHDNQDVAFSDAPHDTFGGVYAGQPLQSSFIFTPDLDTQPVTYPFAADIQIALLRTRYSYNKYLIYRPCIYKALHHPESLTREDAEGAAECLKASLKWPIALSPPCTNKRLVPITCFWSQNLFGVLVLLHLSQQHPMLLRIRSSLCGQAFDVEASQTVTVYLDWLRDMKRVDSTANWCWNIVRLVYRLDD